MDEKLFQFAVQQLGGEDAVAKAFHKDEVQTAVKQGGSIGEIADRLSPEAADVLYSLDISELVDMTKAERPTRRPRRRMSKADMARAIDDVRHAVEGRPDGVKLREIAEHTDYPKNVCQRVLLILRGDGSVVAKGEKAATTYFPA